MNLNTYGLKKYGACPSNRQMEWYRRERIIFFHFGMNTFSDREWGDGTENPENFNPTDLDCRQWVSTIKKAGFTMAILTAKHHDGFCLWPSKYTEHSIKNSPYKDGKGDIVREFTDACREYGIKAGIYLSPWDRHEKTWGTEAYNDFYANQLEELTTNYGKIWECWWDGAGSTEAHYDWGRWAYIVRNNQPDAVIFGSLGATPYVEVRWVGNEKGIAGNPCFATIDEQDLHTEDRIGLNNGRTDGNRFIPGEADVSIRPGWFYHSEQDEHVRTPKNLVKLWFNSIGRNCGFLLNLPPDRRGLINEIDSNNLFEFNKIMKSSMSVNLAQNARVSATSIRCDECSPNMLLVADEDKFYAPADDCNTPVIEFTFDKPVTFNTFVVSELIELGHRIRGYNVSVLEGDEWKLLAKCQCMGYRWAEHFDTVTADRLRLEITDAVDTPAIRSFSLYNFDNELFTEEAVKISSANLLESATAKLEYNGNEIIVDLGGIFPYNTIEFDGDGISEYKLHIFNGTSYELITFNDKPKKNEICKFETITDSYKFKLELKCDGEVGDRNIAVYCK